MTKRLDKHVIIAMLESLGYCVQWINDDDFFSYRRIQILFTNNTMCKPENFGKTKRKIETQLPFTVDMLHYTPDHDGLFYPKVIYMREREGIPCNAINDLSSTYEAQP